MSNVLQTLNNLTYSKEKLGDGRVKLSIEIASEKFEIAKNKVYEKLAPTVKISGFRPGKAPRNLIMAQLGPALFEQTLNELVPECTLEVIRKEDLMPLDQIAYSVEKVADGAGVKYSASFSVFPEFDLPDISKIKIKVEKHEVTDKEIGKVIKQMFSQKSKAKKDEKAEMDDKWAASLNMGVKNLNELKEKIKGELKRQKEMMGQDKVISGVIKEISQKCKFEVPSVLIDKEVLRREMEYKKRIENLGMKVEDFLRNQKTSLEELKKGWKKEAGESIKAEVIIMKISKEYKVKVEEDEITKQIDSIKDEKVKAQYTTPGARRYLHSMMLRQKVIKKILELVKTD